MFATIKDQLETSLADVEIQQEQNSAEIASWEKQSAIILELLFHAKKHRRHLQAKCGRYRQLLSEVKKAFQGLF